MSLTNVSQPVTTFIGRQPELAALRELLDQTRLVTLTGVGGVGKTRMALEVPELGLGAYPDGVWFIDLVGVIDSDGIFEATLKEVGSGHHAPQVGLPPADRIVEVLQGRRLLMIFDNCEHLVGPVGEFVSMLRERCPLLSVLATGREPLGLVGEQMYRVPTMSFPEQDAEYTEMARSDAVRLFCERARSARCDFEISEDNAHVIVELCRRLDGIPLAIELAAARIGSMSPAELLERLHSRFRLLVTDIRGGDERHRRLRRTIDWSYDLLDDSERTMLRRCAVFVGGFDLVAAERVCADEGLDSIGVLELLTHLVEKSLLTLSDRGGSSRYRMLETIREYALDLFGESRDSEIVKERHAMHYRQFATQAGAELRGSEEIEWIDRLDLELDNLRSAIGWALDTYRITIATDIVVALMNMQPTFDETIANWAELVVSYPHPEKDPRLPAIIAFHSYVRYFHNGEPEAADAVKQLLASTEGTRDLRVRSMVVGVAAALAPLNNWPSRPLAEEGIAIARQLEDPFRLVLGLSALAWSGVFDGVDTTAAGEEAVRVATEIGNPTAIALARQALAMTVAEADPVRAIALLDQSISAASSVRDRFVQSVSESLRTNLLVTAIDPHTALNVMMDSIEGALRGQLRGLGINWLEEVAALLAMSGRDEAAAALLGRAQKATFVAPLLWPFAPEEYQQALAALPQRLGANRYAQQLAAGEAMSDEEVIACARSQAQYLPDYR